jgi:hypothetical protein
VVVEAEHRLVVYVGVVEEVVEEQLEDRELLILF